MKKFSALIFALLVGLTLTACNAQNDDTLANGNATDTLHQEQGNISDVEQNNISNDLSRDETTDLRFMVEGMEELVPATLYIGQGYSIYVPNEGWRLEEDINQGIQIDTWESTVNDDVELCVLHLGERTLDQAQDWIITEEEDFIFTEDEQGNLVGTDREDQKNIAVIFYSADNAMYAVQYTYPIEATEGFGTRLSVIASTFEILN